MYSSNYTHVPRYTLEAQKKKQMQRSKGKSCGYYMRIIFFFSSLIQSLIIISLVLFLVYGKKQDSASSGRITDLDQSLNRVSMENLALKQQKRNLTKILNQTMTEKLQLDQDVVAFRNHSATSITFINYLINQLTQCNADRYKQPTTNCPRPFFLPDCNDCRSKLEQLNAMVQFLKSNHNQTALKNSILIDRITAERDDCCLQAIDLRKDKEQLDWEIKSYRVRCKQDFVDSLSGITNVSRGFLEKIDSLFPHHIPFQLTCEKQRDNLEQIRSNCTSLSRDVENTLQRYLDVTGSQVTNTVGQIAHLDAENRRLKKDFQWCSVNRTGMIEEHKQHLHKAQRAYDDEKKSLLLEKKKLGGEKELLESKIRLKDAELNHLNEQIKQRNASCLSRNTLGNRFLGSTITFNPSNTGSRLSAGSTGLNKPATNGINGFTGSTGTDVGKKPSFPNISYGIGLGNTNLGNTNPGSTTLGSTNLGNTNVGGTKLAIGSTGSKVLGSSGTGASGTGRVGSTSTGLAGWGPGTGSAGSYGGLGGGRTGGISVNLLQQHLQELQRYANPSSTEKKNESPKTSG